MKLFEPCRIGKMELKNRLVLAPMSNNMADKGFISEQAVNFYEARARGGVGLITCEDGIVDSPRGNNIKNAVAIDDDKYIPMLRKFNDVVHRYGAKTAMQLSHGGRRAGRVEKSGYLETTGGLIPVAPSAIAHPAPGYVVPEELTVDQIKQLIEKFGQAARRAVEAGFDALSLHCAHMYLCGEFLSPWANKRTDEYGGSFEGRLKFVLEVIARIKKETGDTHPLIVRMNGQEPEGGNSLADIRKIAQAFEKAGVDAVHVSVGFAAAIKDPDFIPSTTNMRFPDGAIIHLAENIKKGVAIPVIAVNKIRDVQLAEQIIQSGKADLIAMGRTLIADPDFAVKSAAGRYEDIRPCISCCQGCIDRAIANLTINCSVNPRVGRADEMELKPAGQKKKVVVVGAGPGGLEAALTARLRGHDVILFEKRDSIGGQLIDAALPPFKSVLNKLTSYYRNQLDRQKIKIRLGVDAIPEMVRAQRPDVVILASGGSPVIPPVPGVDNRNVFVAVDVLRGRVNTGQNVVVIGGGQLGLETAEFLALKGKKVVIVEMLDTVGAGMFPANRLPVLFSLEKSGVDIYTLARVEKIKEGSVVISQGSEKREIKADTVVLAAGYKPDPGFVEGYSGTAAEVYAVGNCVKPGNIMDAVQQGFDIAVKI